MSTTSLKLPDELKHRAAAVAREHGLTPHAFMVGAIAAATTAAEQRADFVAEALAAREEMRRTGLGHDAEEVHAWLRARAVVSPNARPGKAPAVRRPPATPWRG
jgi:predicted transcriptional regulator